VTVSVARRPTVGSTDWRRPVYHGQAADPEPGRDLIGAEDPAAERSLIERGQRRCLAASTTTAARVTIADIVPPGRFRCARTDSNPRTGHIRSNVTASTRPRRMLSVFSGRARTRRFPDRRQRRRTPLGHGRIAWCGSAPQHPDWRWSHGPGEAPAPHRRYRHAAGLRCPDRAVFNRVQAGPARPAWSNPLDARR